MAYLKSHQLLQFEANLEVFLSNKQQQTDTFSHSRLYIDQVLLLFVVMGIAILLILVTAIHFDW